MNYLDILPDSADRDAIVSAHERMRQWIGQDKKGFLRFREPFEALRHYPAVTVDCGQPVVRIGSAAEVSPADRENIRKKLKAFMPWRKGPFSVFGIDIDAEWRSERKWRRVEPVLPSLRGKVIADVGCNNGYYMFRMSAAEPKLVLGFEPGVQHYYCFNALNGMARRENLAIDLLGVEHLALFRECFDIVFLMGVIYHRPSPIDTLRDIHSSLAPGGMVIIESQAIPGGQPVALFPETTYAKVPGTYFVPTGACLINWMKKAGFAKIELFCSHPMSNLEQRRTEWMQFESYENFIDPQNPQLTVEGYPAPLRIFLKGIKKQ